MGFFAILIWYKTIIKLQVEFEKGVIHHLCDWS